MNAMEKHSALFSPYRLRGLELANRVVVSPMCQYSASDGCMNDWHMMHLGTLSGSGAGLLIFEATSPTVEGRITHGCSGLYSDNNEAAMRRVADACRRYGRAKLGVQLGHAGRKGSAQQPWVGGRSIAPTDPYGWQTRSASALALGEGWHAPVPLTIAEIEQLKQDFVTAAHRAERIGLDLIELHFAHGYLFHQFLSPVSNRRDDQYGGSLQNRMRLPLETFAEMRRVWPEHKPMGVRISATDWIAGGWDLEQSLVLCEALQQLGCDYVDVSSGGISLDAKIPVGPAYQTPFAAEIKRQLGIAVMSVGMITEPEQAEAIVREGKADLIALARAFIDDPHWAWHAAYRLGGEVATPDQYHRGVMKTWPPAKRHLAQV